MSIHNGGNAQPSIDIEEHRTVNGVSGKAAFIYGFDGTNVVPLKTDSSGNIVISSSSGAPTAVVAFVTPVTTAGTRVQLSSNTVEGCILEAPSTNTGLIYVGGATVSSTVYGAELQPGQSTSVAIDNTNRIYIDASVNGDKCAVLGS